MAFERYLKQKTVMSKPAAAIWKMGLIAINDAALKESGLDKATYAALFYDREKKRIALRAAGAAKVDGAIKLDRRGGGVVIYSKGFSPALRDRSFQGPAV